MLPERESMDAVAQVIPFRPCRSGPAGPDQKANMFGNAEAYERYMGRSSRLVAPLLVDFTTLPERAGARRRKGVYGE
jgi:hypothetical protein